MGGIPRLRHHYEPEKVPFPLGNKWVLLFSRMDESRSAQFIAGGFDGERLPFPGS